MLDIVLDIIQNWKKPHIIICLGCCVGHRQIIKLRKIIDKIISTENTTSLYICKNHFLSVFSLSSNFITYMYIAFSCPSLLSSGSFDINSIYIHWPRGCWRTRQLLLAVIHRLPFWHSHISCDYVHSSICEQMVN